MPTSLTNLLDLYSVPGGRYTYYPVHSGWKNNLNYFQWWDSIKKDYDPKKGIDLYIHIPFCQSLCTFCGCNIRVSKNYDGVTPYINSLKKEWSFYQKILGDEIKINSIYIGGGSPNFLTASDLSDLLTFFKGNQDTQISIELDPRFLSLDQLQVLKIHNVHMLSFGVQDLNPKVLENVNRDQSSEQFFDLISRAREMGFQHINIDLIYGLTHQTPESIAHTLEILKSGHAESIALYPLAKVPWQNNSQKAFGDFKDFSRHEMNNLFAVADCKLKDIGYTHIGMGHYARSNSNFLKTYKEKKLKRNIMGFTEKKSNLLIGLGVSSFSNSPTGHIQNEKVLEQYLFAIQKDRPPIYKSHTISPDELKLSALFEKIVCEGYFTQQDRSDILPDQEANFNIFLSNNFVELVSDKFLITDLGKYFLKNICQFWG